jgi:hypothetical protein
MVAPVTQGPPQAPPGSPGGQAPGLAPQALQAMQQFVQALRADPQTAPLLPTLVALLQSSPDMPRKLIGLLLDQGPQVLLQLLQQAAQSGVGQQGGPPPGQPPPPPRNDGPPPSAPGGPPPGAMAPPQQGPPPPMQPPPPPPQDPQAREHLLSELRPELSRVFRALNPDQQSQVLQLFAQRGIGAVEGLLGQLLAARQQTGPGVPSNAPGRKQDGPDYPGATKLKKKRSKATPAFELRPLPRNRWGAKGPSYATCTRHLRQGKTLMQDRDNRIREDIQLYNQSRTRAEDIPMGPRPGRPFNAAGGDIVHISSRPFAFVERVTAYCTASGDRAMTVDCPPWSDDDDTVNASQALEDWLTYGRDQDERQWIREAAAGNPRMPLPRIEAGGMALLGGAGFRVGFDPEDKQHPVWGEYVPLNRLYPVPGQAICYSETMTLAEARVTFPEIDDYYPSEDQDTAPRPDMTVTIGAWTDVYPKGQGGLWHAIFWESGGEWGDDAEKNRAKWIKEPTRIDFGFPVYQYVIWGGAPYYATQDVGDYERFRGMGCLTPLRRAFKLFDLLQSAIATQAVKLVDPAVMMYYVPGTRKEDMKRVSTLPGSTNFGIVGEKVEPLVWSVAGSPDGNAILQSIWQEISDMDSPLLKGGGTANSGFQQTLQAGAAASVQVNPIIDALERYRELLNTCKAELAIRKGGEGELAKLPYPSRPVEDQFDAIYPTFKSLTPEMIKLNGTQNIVTMNRLSLQEQQVLWSMVEQAVQTKMLSAREGMKRMGVANPQRNFLRILQELAVTNPKSLEAMTGAAIMGGGNALLQVGWQQVLMAASQGPPPGPGGPPGGGVPSPPAPVTGGPQGRPPAEMVGQRGPM